MEPMSSRVDALLTRSRLGVARLEPAEVQSAVASGALLIDTRTDSQRAVQGNLPGALVIDRTVLEWRLDPTSPWRIAGRDFPRAWPQPA